MIDPAMNHAENTTFVPTLTVLPELGCAFLWIVTDPDEKGVGGNLCDGMGWDESFPLSEGLYRKFIDWNLTFEVASREVGYDIDLGNDWDWVAFHARGLQLSRWLKEEIGSAYRVVYLKLGEDPNRHIDERTEIFANSKLVPLPSFRNPSPKPR